MPKSTKKRVTKKVNKQPSPKQPAAGHVKNFYSHALLNLKTYLARRPHRSFRMSRMRDYKRSLELPGYWAFNTYVWRTIMSHKKLFGGLVLFYMVLGIVFIGLSSQETYSQLSSFLDKSGTNVFSGGWGIIGQAGLLLLSGASGNLNPQLNEVQQVFSGIILLLTWLTSIWLLRATLSGKAPRLRDGIYNAGSPIVATAIVLIILVIQLVPAALALIVFNAALGSNLFDSGAVSMFISVTAMLLIILTIYWITSTIFALVIVTLPGMYPWQAIRTAGDLVVGRRIRILLRFIWLALGILITWAIILLPTILLDRGIKGVFPAINWLPIVPFVIAAVTAVIVVWGSSYVYLLYRKIVEDDAQPA